MADMVGPDAWLLASTRASVRHLLGGSWDLPLCQVTLRQPPILVTLYQGKAISAEPEVAFTGELLPVCSKCQYVAEHRARSWGLTLA